MTSKAYVLEETAILVNGEVSADVALSAEGVADAAGRVSAVQDWGAGPRAFMYDWVCEVQWQATPTQYGTLDIYLAEYDESGVPPGDIGTSDAALGDVDQLRNLRYIGSVTVEDAATTLMVASGSFESTKQYHQFVVLNDGGATINATDSNFVLRVTPKAVQGQDT